MKKKKQKYYVVRKGRKSGIYDTRDACKEQVHAYTGAQYKSFDTPEDAKQAFADTYEKALNTSGNSTSVASLMASGIIVSESICVDAACEGNPGILERRGVKTVNASEIFHSKKYPVGTVNIGERLALIQGMHRLIKHQKTHRVLYSDSRTAMSWIRQGILRTTLKRNKNTEKLRQAIDAGKERLSTHREEIAHINIIKRKTSEWGEIPADFGRK